MNGDGLTLTREVASLLFSGLCLFMLVASVRLFYMTWKYRSHQRVLERLNAGRPQLLANSPGWDRVERFMLRVSPRSSENANAWLLAWGVGVVLGLMLGSWFGLLFMLVVPPVCGRLYLNWVYNRQMQKMISQLPTFLDQTIRSLKAGRSLADALLNSHGDIPEPLNGSIARVRRNVQLGVSLPEAIQDFADLYEQDELRILALGLRVNHRYGGNASELLDNLMRMIREREQAARQLRAMTGETRLTALVLASLPVCLVAYFLLTNPAYLMNMWGDPSGRNMLMVAFGFQVFGCLALWRMLRSI